MQNFENMGITEDEARSLFATIGECVKGFRKQKFPVASNLMDPSLKNKGPPLKQARIPAIAGAHCYRETARYNW